MNKRREYPGVYNAYGEDKKGISGEAGGDPFYRHLPPEIGSVMPGQEAITVQIVGVQPQHVPPGVPIPKLDMAGIDPVWRRRLEELESTPPPERLVRRVVSRGATSEKTQPRTTLLSDCPPEQIRFALERVIIDAEYRGVDAGPEIRKVLFSERQFIFDEFKRHGAYTREVAQERIGKYRRLKEEYELDIERAAKDESLYGLLAVHCGEKGIGFADLMKVRFLGYLLKQAEADASVLSQTAEKGTLYAAIEAINAQCRLQISSVALGKNTPSFVNAPLPPVRKLVLHEGWMKHFTILYRPHDIPSFMDLYENEESAFAEKRYLAEKLRAIEMLATHYHISLPEIS